jgi:hypothetical protein
MNSKRVTGLAFASLIVTAAVASAAILWTPTAGGFVGKGDVQTALGMNNAALQAAVAADALEFTYESTDVYAAVCSWVTGEGTRGEQQHDVTIPRHVTLGGVVSYTGRNHNQIDGFFLDAADSQGGADVPTVGDACVGNETGIAQNGTWSAVSLLSSSGGELQVNGVTLATF